MSYKEARDCFVSAIKDEKKGKKHKGLLITQPDDKKAEEYLAKAKMNLELCYFYKEKGFEYKFEPIEDSIIIKDLEEKGYEVHYLVQDNDVVFSPDEDRDDNLFLVNYHRDFDVRNDKIISENDLKNWYRQEFDDYKESWDDENEVGKFPLEEKYHIFLLSCLVHSGVWLSLQYSFICDTGGWDTSHVGAVLVSKEEWPEEEKAVEAAEGLVKTWNQYLSGDVYGIITEIYDKEKKQIDYDSCWGYYGYKEALAELKREVEENDSDREKQNESSSERHC